MAEHPNGVRMRQYLEAFDRGDFDAVRDFFADDIVWHVAGSHALSGDYRGKDELIDYFHKARKSTAGTLNVEPTVIMADDRHIAMFVRVTGDREGRTLDIEMAETFTVRPDGTWSEFWSMPDDQAKVDAFWS